MVRVGLVPLEQAKQTRKPKAIGARRTRMNVFDALAAELINSDGEAGVIYELEPEDGVPQKFVLSLRAAFKRAGETATVKKLRGRAEVRAWLNTEPKAARQSRQKRIVEPARELAGVGG